MGSAKRVGLLGILMILAGTGVTLGADPQRLCPPAPLLTAPTTTAALPASRALRPHHPALKQETKFLNATGTGSSGRGVNFGSEIPVSEISLGLPLGTVSGLDNDAWAEGKANGELVLVTSEGFGLKSAYSSDGGATFAPEVVIEPGTDPPTRLFLATLSSDGVVYLVYQTGDPQGDIGLRFRRSLDMGRTWSAPVDLVKSGDPIHGIASVYSIAANGSGRVALVFREEWEGEDDYVMVSSDRGDHWTAPVKVDSGDTSNQFACGWADVAVDGTGTVHVTFVQDRGTGNQVWYTHSTDGGNSYSPEIQFDSLLPGRNGSDNPTVRIANDGSVLVAFWDKFGSDYIFVVRSTNGGTSFSRTFMVILNGSDTAVFPILAPYSGTNTLLLGFVQSNSLLRTARSINNGATFGSLNSHTSSAVRLRIARSSAGRWVVAWEDHRTDTIFDRFHDIYARSSTTDAASFDSEQRADRDTAGAAASTLCSLTAGGADQIFLAYLDERDENGRATNVYANRSTTSPLDFSTNERRVDQDTTIGNLTQYANSMVATDGGSHLCALHTATLTGPWPDLFVSCSADAGRSFAAPVRVSTTPAGAQDIQLSQIAVLPDGKVYVAYAAHSPAGYEILFNRSTDYGAHWLSNSISLKTVTDFGDIRMSAQPTGALYIAFSDNTTVFLSTSLDFGMTFSTSDVDQNDSINNIYPRVCSQGDQVVLVWEAPNGSLYWSIWGTVSADQGKTWSTRVQLRPELTSNAYLPEVACDGTDAAVAVWEDSRNSGWYMTYANRFSGTNWLGDININGPTGTFQFNPQPLFVTPTTFLVSYGDGSDCWLSRSTDGGLSFLPYQRLDDLAPQPLAKTNTPVLATDGQGNVWTAFMDWSPGFPGIAMRYSTDGGATFGPVTRADRETPQGFYYNRLYTWGPTSLAAAPGKAYVVFNGERWSPFWDARFQVWDAGDFDRDGFAAGSDCNDADPSAGAVPIEVTPLTLTEAAPGIHLEWPSQAATAGSGSVYDLVGGDVSELTGAGNFGAAACLAGGLASPAYDDLRTGPDPGRSFYYLAHGRNSCGNGTFGDSTESPDPRDALDAVCPCP